MILLEIKLWVFQKIHKNIIQGQLQMGMMSQKIIDNIIYNGVSKNNFLDNKLNQPTKFRTKNWVEIND